MSSPRGSVRVLRNELRRVVGSWKRPSYVPPKDWIEAVYGLTLDEWQRAYVKNALEQPRVAVVASRQSGKSQVVAGVAAWCCVYNSGFECLVTSKTQKQAAHFLKKVKAGISRVIKPGQIISNSKTEIELGNGSLVAALPCRDVEAVRGYSPDLVIMDEAAFAPEDLISAISPSLAATGGALHMISSPNGPSGFFYQSVAGDLKDEYWTRKVTVEECPRITKEYLDEQKILLGDIFFRQEFFSEFLAKEHSFFGTHSITSLFDGAEDADLSGIDDVEPMDTLFVDVNRRDVQQSMDTRMRVKRLMFDS